jgi:acyl-coenzyme A synthetase/AMP-(fatty) acid ligase
MAWSDVRTLRDSISNTSARFYDRNAVSSIADLNCGTVLGGRLAELSGRSVLVATEGQLTTALALIEIDGVAQRLVIIPPDLDTDTVSAVIATAGINSAVLDRGVYSCDVQIRVSTPPSLTSIEPLPGPSMRTEWVLLTSGTTGMPKMVVHDLRGLTGAIAGIPSEGTVWGTFYDIRRYGGLQIFLRAMAGGTSLVLSHAGEPIDDHLSRLAEHNVTHLSGTPSHWRRALMSPVIGKIAPRYLRLSGEIADQSILDALRAAFPLASIGHAYASTEAGVAFEVADGLAGFPAAFLSSIRSGVEMKIVEGSLRIRSSRTASGYVGARQALADCDGFVDTGDIVERRADRYYFVGRKGGIINVGGLKVHPEEVEHVINQHPRVLVSLVQSRQNPITGAIVMADVVLKPCGRETSALEVQIKNEILGLCRAALPRHKVPAVIGFVPGLAVAATGKLARRYV